MWSIRCLETSITEWHGVVKHVTEGQKAKILLQESKNCKIQGITVFCNYSCSVVTGYLAFMKLCVILNISTTVSQWLTQQHYSVTVTHTTALQCHSDSHNSTTVSLWVTMTNWCFAMYFQCISLVLKSIIIFLRGLNKCHMTPSSLKKL
jgi:hypothetical protein